MTDMEDKINTLQAWVDESRTIVAFTGAGFSTESGLKDFRSVDGLYHEAYDYPPEEILSHTFFEKRPAEFFRFYRDKMLAPEAQPNPAHRKLAELERAGKLSAVVTQNIDGLHQAAGSRTVWELHGSVHRNSCICCGKDYTAADILTRKPLPTCDCGCIIKPDVVLYEEQLRGDVLEGAIRAISRADLLIVGGTSLAVYPAAGLVNYYTGNRLVLINKSPTPYDHKADLLIEGAVGQVLDQIKV